MTPKPFDNQAQRAKVLDRVRKLLAQSKGTSFEAEAQTAMRMAQDFMTKYGLSMSDVELSEALQDPITEVELNEHSKRQTPELWSQMLLAAVRVVFDCDALLNTHYEGGKRTKTFRLVGYQADVEMAKAAFTVLYLATRAAACREVPEAGRPRLSFMYGVAERLWERARAEKQTAKQEPSGRFALVVRSKAQNISDFVKEHHNVKPCRSRGMSLDPGAYEQGRRHDGRMDLLNRQKVSRQPTARLEHKHA